MKIRHAVYEEVELTRPYQSALLTKGPQEGLMRCSRCGECLCGSTFVGVLKPGFPILRFHVSCFDEKPDQDLTNREGAPDGHQSERNPSAD